MSSGQFKLQICVADFDSSARFRQVHFFVTEDRPSLYRKTSVLQWSLLGTTQLMPFSSMTSMLEVDVAFVAFCSTEAQLSRSS